MIKFKKGDAVKKTTGVIIPGLKVTDNFYDKRTAHLSNYKDYVPVVHPDGTKEKYHPSHLALESKTSTMKQLNRGSK